MCLKVWMATARPAAGGRPLICMGCMAAERTFTAGQVRPQARVSHPAAQGLGGVRPGMGCGGGTGVQDCGADAVADAPRLGVNHNTPFRWEGCTQANESASMVQVHAALVTAHLGQVVTDAAHPRITAL